MAAKPASNEEQSKPISLPEKGVAAEEVQIIKNYLLAALIKHAFVSALSSPRFRICVTQISDYFRNTVLIPRDARTYRTNLQPRSNSRNPRN
jgi:hypothetical protein